MILGLDPFTTSPSFVMLLGESTEMGVRKSLGTPLPLSTMCPWTHHSTSLGHWFLFYQLSVLLFCFVVIFVVVFWWGANIVLDVKTLWKHKHITWLLAGTVTVILSLGISHRVIVKTKKESMCAMVKNRTLWWLFSVFPAGLHVPLYLKATNPVTTLALGMGMWSSPPNYNPWSP